MARDEALVRFIQDFRPGDRIIGYNGSVMKVSRKVRKPALPTALGLYEGKGGLFFTHRDEGWFSRGMKMKRSQVRAAMPLTRYVKA